VFKGVMKKGYKVPTPIQRKVRGSALLLPCDSHPLFPSLWLGLHVAYPLHRCRKLHSRDLTLVLSWFCLPVKPSPGCRAPLRWPLGTP
jgi:hypothetical protein